MPQSGISIYLCSSLAKQLQNIRHGLNSQKKSANAQTKDVCTCNFRSLNNGANLL